MRRTIQTKMRVFLGGKKQFYIETSGPSQLRQRKKDNFNKKGQDTPWSKFWKTLRHVSNVFACFASSKFQVSRFIHPKVLSIFRKTVFETPSGPWSEFRKIPGTCKIFLDASPRIEISGH